MQARSSGFVRSSYILGLVALVWAGGIALIQISYIRFRLVRQTERIQRQAVAEWIRLTEYFLRAEGNRILMLTTGWSTAPVVNEYLEKEVHSELKGESPAISFHKSGISMVIFCDSHKRVLSAFNGKGRNLTESDLLQPGDDISKSAVFSIYSNREDVFGIGQSPLGLALFARCAVRRDDGERIGYIVSIRPMDASLFAGISAIVGAKVALVSAYELPDERPVSAYGQIIWTERDCFVKGAQVLRDSTGTPVGYIVVSGVAQSARQLKMVRKAFAVMVGLVIGFAGLMIIIIHALISGPTATLLRRVEQIRSGRKVDNLSKNLRGEALVLAKRFERVLAHVEKLSRTDFLTGLWNRRSFERSLVQEFYRARRYNRPLSLMIMDVDHFKTTNDTFGHQVGDSMLQILADVLKKEIRSHDIAARFGGDEFAVLMPETALSEAITVAKRIQQSLAGRPVGNGELEMACTVSVGIADTSATGVGSPEELVGLSDQALYVAKRRGRNQIATADKDVIDRERSDEESTSLVTVRKNDMDVLARRLLARAMNGLTDILELRDKLIVNHSANVCKYSVLIARQMHLPEGVVEGLAQAARLHDIGKIVLPDSILLKEGPLTEREWELMKQHPVVSAQILEYMGIFEREVPAVRSHHERYDGTGYPSGLGGPAIPLGARILAVADAFDAMTSPRSYKDSLTIEQAVEELRRHKNSQFDPAIVDVFIDVINSGNITIRPSDARVAV